MRVSKALLTRFDCTIDATNSYVKDLSKLGRDLKDVIILDNSPVAYKFHPENAIPCVDFLGDKSDTELLKISEILLALENETDVRKVIPNLK